MKLHSEDSIVAHFLQINMKSYQRQDDMDPAELLLFAKDSFMK